MKKNVIPNKWKKLRLGEITKHIGGTPLEKYVDNQSDYKFISIGNYNTNGKYIDNGNRIQYNEKTKEKLLNKNDLVMVLNDKTTDGKIIGNTIFIDENNKYIYNQRSERIICKDMVNPKFLWHYTNSSIFKKEILKRMQGGTQIYVNYKDIEKIELNIPSLEEQEKIVNILDNVDKIIEQYEKILEEKDKFIKSQFIDMFGNPYTNNKKVEKCEIANVLTSIKSGLSRQLSDSNIGIPVIRSNNIVEGKIVNNDLKYWYINDPKGADVNDYLLEKGDLLVNFINSIAQIGKSGIYDSDENCIYTTNLFRLRTNKKCNNVYLYYCFMMEDYWRQIRNIVQPAANQASFTMNDFKKIKILLPDIKKQEQFADLVIQIDKQKIKLKELIENYQKLKKSLIQKLLTGELRVKI